MYALIRFLEDLDNWRHVVPVHVIHDFHPTNKADFDNKAVYTVFRDDDVGEDTGDYNAKILMLAGKCSVSGLEIRLPLCLKPWTSY